MITPLIIEDNLDNLSQPVTGQVREVVVLWPESALESPGVQTATGQSLSGEEGASRHQHQASSPRQGLLSLHSLGRLVDPDRAEVEAERLISLLYALPAPLLSDLSRLFSHEGSSATGLGRLIQDAWRNRSLVQVLMPDLNSLPPFIESMKRGARRREQPLPPLEEIDPFDFAVVDEDEVLTPFLPGGCFQDLEGYETREGQVEMARLVLQAFNRCEHLLVEAGTGVGKSWAYLVPSIKWSMNNGRPVVISTHTINLQEQLIERDIPKIRQVLGGSWEAVLLKGREHYLCLRRWLSLKEDLCSGSITIDPDERLFWAEVLTWFWRTQSGDREELGIASTSHELWRLVSSQGSLCGGPECPHFQGACYLRAVRNRAASAQLVVVNHSLLFSDLKAGNRVLPSYAQLVMDEAHNLEDAATGNLGREIGFREVKGWLDDLLRPFSHRGKPGFFTLMGGEAAVSDLVAHLRRQAQKASLEFESFLQMLMDRAKGHRRLQSYGRETTCRLLRPELTDEPWQHWFAAGEGLHETVSNLADGLLDLATLLEPAEEGEGGPVLRRRREEALRNGAFARDLSVDLQFFLDMNSENHVFWVSWVGDPPQHGRLYAAPIHLGEELVENLFSRVPSVVMTSATLSVGGTFDFIKERSGLERIPSELCNEASVNSPFDYRSQALLSVPTDFPDPATRGEGGEVFQQSVNDFVSELVTSSRDPTLVLFTSHRMLRRTHAYLREQMPSVPVLGQGVDGSRGQIIREFRRRRQGLLLGTSSFWEGVDLPGEELTCVVLVKLPFWPPTRPVVEARMEALEAEGKSSFYYYALPQAAIGFKQGFGRLIRSTRDVGAVVCLDNRIVSKNYGRFFVESLPGPHLCFGPRQVVLRETLSWLGRN